MRRGLAFSFALLVLGSSGSARPAVDWQTTLDRAVRGVVVLRVSVTRSFDTERGAYTTATGFVVDAERGLILTNRHVVKPGPVVAEAVFLDHEEVEVQAVYRDPVHDFGFFRYDPADVKFMEPAELELVPGHARVGTDIRVAGNDAGEKLSILAGTLARLDREAPTYSQTGYNDFNTFYYQAASSSSGGSSGSPVLDVHGHVVALNSGGKRLASSSFYLPLDRVVRALELIQNGDPVPRGTLQTIFVRRPYDELRRLGLRADTEAMVREVFPDSTGMLVVDQTIPGGTGDGELEPGDVLVRAGSGLLTSFSPLEAFLDERVGEEILLEVERGGEPLVVQLRVEDLHAITPASYVEMGGGVLNSLSYQQARNHGLPVGGAYVASPGYVLSRARVPRGAVITAVQGRRVATPVEFESLVTSFAEGARVPVRYFRLDDPRTESVAIITIDRHWFGTRRCVREDGTGRWPCLPARASPPPIRANAVTTQLEVDGERPVREIAPSLVLVDFDVPYRVDGVHGVQFHGTGIVIDAERGLVIVDRETVPVALGDVNLTFGGSVEVPGQIIYIHPAHNLAVVGYDPELLGDSPVRSAKLRQDRLAPGEKVWLVGLNARHELVQQRTNVSTVEPLILPLTNPPRFRDTNLEVVRLSDATSTLGGAVVDKKGRVRALWASFSAQRADRTHSFFAGIPAARVAEIAAPLREGRPVGWRSLGVELHPLTLAESRNRGLSDAAARAFEELDPERRRVLSVARLTAGTASSELLAEGDLIFSVDEKLATSFETVEKAARAERVRVVVFRDGVEHTFDVPTEPLSGRGTDRAVLWAGALLQAPHRAVAAQRGIAPDGVYVGWYWYGSPANRFGLRATRRIVAIDGMPTPDLDAFLRAVAARPDRGAVRVKTIDLDDKVDVITLKLDLQYWPTYELVRGTERWDRVRLD